MVRTAIVAAGLAAVLASCSSPTVCETFDDKLVDACGQPAPEPIEACEDGTKVACLSACGLAAECDVLLASGDVFDADYSARAENFTACIEGC